MKDKKITNFNEAIHEAASDHCLCMGIHGDYESFRKGTEWMIKNTYMDFQTELLRNSDLTHSLFVVRKYNSTPFSQKQLDDAEILIKLQKEEIARQITMRKHALKKAFLFGLAVGSLIMVFIQLMGLIF